MRSHKMEGKQILKYGVIAVIIVAIVILLLVVVVYLWRKFGPTIGSFAGFGAEYKNIGSYQDLDPFIEFVAKNRYLAEEFNTGTLTIDKVSVVYGDFLTQVREGKVDNAPLSIVEAAQKVMGYMATGQDFTSVKNEPFILVGQGIVNIDRLCQTYLHNLRLHKDKVGGTDPNAAKLYDDYIKSNRAKEGYVQQFLNNAQVEEFSSNPTQAEKYRQDVSEDLVFSSMLNNTDPREKMREYDYQDHWDDVHARTKHMAPKQVYDRIDKRYPGPYDRRFLDDEPYSPYDKDAKDPNVPRPGILGKVADEPYHYDRKSGLWHRRA